MIYQTMDKVGEESIDWYALDKRQIALPIPLRQLTKKGSD